MRGEQKTYYDPRQMEHAAKYNEHLIRMIRVLGVIEYGDVSVRLRRRRQDLNDVYKEWEIKRERRNKR